MNKLFLLTTIIMLLVSGCAALLDPQKDIAIAEDIVDDIVKEETGIPLDLRDSTIKK